MLHPVDVLAAENVGDGSMSLRGRGHRAVPVLHARRRPDHIAGLDLPLASALLLDPASPGGDDQKLPGRMGVPGGSSTGRKDNVSTCLRRLLVRCVIGLDENVPYE